MAPLPEEGDGEEPHTPRPASRHFDFEDLPDLDELENLPQTGHSKVIDISGGEAGCGGGAEGGGAGAAADESSRASTWTAGAGGSHSAGGSESSEPEALTPRTAEAAEPTVGAADWLLPSGDGKPGQDDGVQMKLHETSGEPGAVEDGGSCRIQDGVEPDGRCSNCSHAAMEKAQEGALQPETAGAGLVRPSSPGPAQAVVATTAAAAAAAPGERPAPQRRRRRHWALRPSVGTWLTVLPGASAAAVGGESCWEEVEELEQGSPEAAPDVPGAAEEKEPPVLKHVEEAPMIRRARWGGLTIDLHHYSRRDPGEASTRQAAASRRPPALDALPQWAELALAPMRERLQRAARERLASYDVSKSYPRPQDAKHGTRYVYEQHLLGEGLPQLREELKRTYNHGCLGQVWRVVGGGKTGGILVRIGSDLNSPQADGRLTTGSLVEHVSLNKDRLNYRLVSGRGPPTGWISVRYQGADRTEKVMAVKVPVGERAERAGEETNGNLTEAQERPVIVGLMAAHIRTEARLKRFKHVLRSVRRQLLHSTEAEFLFAVSWSSSLELACDVHAAVEAVAKEPGYTEVCPGQEMIAVRQTQRHSQFQHLQAASHLAEDTLRERWGPEASKEGRAIWAMFGDDDDIWHHSRVAELANAIRMHPFIHGVGVFATTARLSCKQTLRLKDEDMPVTEDQADEFLRRGRGVRLDEEPVCIEWLKKLRNDPAKAPTLPVPQELGLEYFDLCPRLRLLREFYAKSSPEFVEHRYCDLHFNEFLCTYTRKGAEMGLEVSFFFPRCWMLFYATPIPDEKAVKSSVERADAEKIDVNNGHMSANYTVEPPEEELARRCVEEFRTYDHRVTEARVARYWAAFRNAVEVYLVRYHRDKIDQRLFDCYVWFAICSSFFEFWDNCCKLPKDREKIAYDMLMYLGQGYARTVALNFECSVLWLRPNIFMEPEFDGGQQQQQQHPGYVGGGSLWWGQGSKFGKKPPPWGSGPWGSKSPPSAKSKPFPKVGGGPTPSVWSPGGGAKQPASGKPVNYTPLGKGSIISKILPKKPSYWK